MSAPDSSLTLLPVTYTAPFSPAVEDRLDGVQNWCQSRGGRLTDTRRQVLGLILSDPRPSGAYDLLAKLRLTHRSAAPPTVYRALDFLLEAGLIHRIERLSAFVGCSHATECGSTCSHHAEQGVHRAQFLICRSCGKASELEDTGVIVALLDAARRAGFRPESAAIEIEGLCASCQCKELSATAKHV